MNTDLLTYYVSNYQRCPSYNNFIKIAEHVTPCMVRGGMNEDTSNMTINNGMVHLALVYRGYKPICYIYNNPDFNPDLIDKLGLKMIKYSSYGGFTPRWIENFIIWKNDEQYKTAIKLSRYLMTYEYNNETIDEHDRYLGKCLGYPEKDIECFISRK